MSKNLRNFTNSLAGQDLREVDLALALIWFLGQETDHSADVSVREIAEILRNHRLRSSINSSRLASKLAKEPNLVKGSVAGSFRIRAGTELRFAEKYREHAAPELRKVTDSVIPDSISLGGRAHLQTVRREANGCYEQGFYNSTAVMCRRLIEVLLIEAFAKAGHTAAISDANGDFRPLSDILSAAKSKSYIRLSRGSGGLLDKVKLVGDAAAHHRFYTTTKRDIDDLNPALRQVISELAALSGL